MREVSPKLLELFADKMFRYVEGLKTLKGKKKRAPRARGGVEVGAKGVPENPYVPGTRQEFQERITSPEWEKLNEGEATSVTGRHVQPLTKLRLEVDEEASRLGERIRPHSSTGLVRDEKGLHGAAARILAVSGILERLEKQKWTAYKAMKAAQEQGDAAVAKVAQQDFKEIGKRQYGLLHGFAEDRSNPLMKGVGWDVGVSVKGDARIKTYGDLVRTKMGSSLFERFDFLVKRAQKDLMGMEDTSEMIGGVGRETPRKIAGDLNRAISEFEKGNYTAAFHRLSAVGSGIKGYPMSKHLDYANSVVGGGEDIPEYARVAREPDLTPREKYDWKVQKMEEDGGEYPGPFLETDAEKEAYEGKMKEWRGEESRLKRLQMASLSRFAKRPWEDPEKLLQGDLDRSLGKELGTLDPLDPVVEPPVAASLDQMKPRFGGEEVAPNMEVARYVESLGRQRMIQGLEGVADKRNRTWQKLLGNMVRTPGVLERLKKRPLEFGEVRELLPEGVQVSPQSLKLLQMLGVLGAGPEDMESSEELWSRAVEGWLSREGSKL